MKPPAEILNVWNKFSDFPMETLTKAWYFNKSGNIKQRPVALMQEHRAQYGASGNCFDLAIWLLDEFQKAGVKAYPIGDDSNPDRMHAAAIAIDENGHRYLCDLGDQWLSPILVDKTNEAFTPEPLSGFFPAARVGVTPNGQQAEIQYHRPNGKISYQVYNLAPMPMRDFLEAAEYSQHHINPEPLVECRVPHGTEIAHWEFDNWRSFLSTSDGLFPDPDAATLEEWAARISRHAGFDEQFTLEALVYFLKLKN